MPKTALKLSLLGLFPLLAYGCSGLILFQIANHIDSGWIYYIADSLLHGETIYSSGRRVFHAPFVFQLHALWFLFIGNTFEHALLLALVFQAINAMLFFFLIKRLTQSASIAILGSGLFISMMVCFGGAHFELELYVVTFQLLALIGIERYVIRCPNSDTNAWFLIGLFSGLSSYAKQTGSLTILGIMLWICLVAPATRHRILPKFILGALLPWAVFLLFFGENPWLVFDGLVIALFDYASNGGSQTTMDERLVELLHQGFANPWSLFLSILLFFEATLGTRLRWKKTESKDRCDFIRLLAFIYFLNLIPRLVNEFHHYYLCCIPSLLVLCCLRLESISLLFSQNRKRGTVMASLFGMLFLFSLLQLSFLPKYAFNLVTSSQIGVPDRLIQKQRAEIIRLLVNEGSDRVWVTANPLLHFLSGTKVPSKLYSFREMSKLEEIEQRISRLDVIVLSQIGRNTFREEYAHFLKNHGFVTIYDPATTDRLVENEAQYKLVIEPHLNCFLYRDDWTIIFARPENAKQAIARAGRPICVQVNHAANNLSNQRGK